MGAGIHQEIVGTGIVDLDLNNYKGALHDAQGYTGNTPWAVGFPEGRQGNEARSSRHLQNDIDDHLSRVG